MKEWHFGEWLRKNIYALNLKSMEDFANKIYYSRDTVYRHLRGKTKPTFGVLMTYCWAFDCIDQVEELWGKVCEEYDERR